MEKVSVCSRTYLFSFILSSSLLILLYFASCANASRLSSHTLVSPRQNVNEDDRNTVSQEQWSTSLASCHGKPTATESSRTQLWNRLPRGRKMKEENKTNQMGIQHQGITNISSSIKKLKEDSRSGESNTGNDQETRTKRIPISNRSTDLELESLIGYADYSHPERHTPRHN